MGMAGPAPQLQWLKISDLVIDPAYQRPVTQQGRKNIAMIVKDFRWSRFSCVIVSPIPGGRYAIVDGQHRVTAAALVGFETVPCQIILATPAEQAQAFASINGAVTRPHTLSLHRAALLAGDEIAVQIDRVAKSAGVTVLRHPKPELKQAPGETMSVVALRTALSRYGADVVTLALRCVRETRNDVCGGLPATIIIGVSHAIFCMLAMGDVPDDEMIRRFDSILLIREADKARREERKDRKSLSMVFAERIISILSDRKAA